MIDVSLLISLGSLAVAIIVACVNIKRNMQSDDKKDASAMTTLIVKLENIGEGVNEIKSDMRNLRSDLQELRDRVIKVESSSKSAHHRLDIIEGNHTISDD